jgi:hypothetical protein
MANTPRREKAEKTKYEGKEYLDYEEAMDYLGMKRATLYNYVNDLDIPTHKFKRERRRYIAMSDIQKIEQVLEKPWLGKEFAATHS